MRISEFDQSNCQDRIRSRASQILVSSEVLYIIAILFLYSEIRNGSVHEECLAPGRFGDLLQRETGVGGREGGKNSVTMTTRNNCFVLFCN